MADSQKKGTSGSSEEEMGFDINTDENQSGTTHLNDPLVEESDLEKLKSELDEAKDKYLRKVAEFENFKRRNAKERLDMIQTAGRDVIGDMLSVLDDFERAENQVESGTDPETANKGMLLVVNKLRNTLTSRGVKAMETLHLDFDPDLHEAVTEIPTDKPELKGKIVDELQKGYYMNDKIIRHAKVVVGK